MSYPYLKRGDRLPSVGILQKLLNARDDAELGVDGIFGRLTQEAVRNFQLSRRLQVDGIVGVQTWPRLTAAESNLRVMDFIDIFDESLLDLEATDIRRAGGNPLLMGGTCNGLEQAIYMIRSASAGCVFLLRFHGHGNSGLAGVGFGHGEEGFQRNTFNNAAVKHVRETIAKLRGAFGPYGCVQFMHCNVAQGREGRSFLANMADILQVPVSAGIHTQYGGGYRGYDSFRFTGPTHTALPGGKTLKSWCSGLPEFLQMSVA